MSLVAKVAELPMRIQRRLTEILKRQRLRLGCRLFRGGDFLFWGRYSDEHHKDLVSTPPNPEWLIRGEAQIELLQKLGLKPEHNFLDYGCAFLATAYHVVPYLEPHRYVGVDVAKLAMLRGVKRLSDAGIDRSRYQIMRIESPDLYELEGFSFDFIFSFSVLQFVHGADHVHLMKRLDSLLRPGGIMLFDYSPFNSDELKQKGMAFHSFEDYQKILPMDNYTVETMSFSYPTGLPVQFAILRKK